VEAAAVAARTEQVTEGATVGVATAEAEPEVVWEAGVTARGADTCKSERRRTLE